MCATQALATALAALVLEYRNASAFHGRVTLDAVFQKKRREDPYANGTLARPSEAAVEVYTAPSATNAPRFVEARAYGRCGDDPKDDPKLLTEAEKACRSFWRRSRAFPFRGVRGPRES